MTADRREVLGDALHNTLCTECGAGTGFMIRSSDQDKAMDALMPLVDAMCAEAAADALIQVGATALACTPGEHPVLVPVSRLFDVAEQLYPTRGATQ